MCKLAKVEDCARVPHKDADYNNRTSSEPAPEVSFGSAVFPNLVVAGAHYIIEQNRTHGGDERANKQLREILEWGYILDLLVGVQPDATLRTVSRRLQVSSGQNLISPVQGLSARPYRNSSCSARISREHPRDSGQRCSQHSDSWCEGQLACLVGTRLRLRLNPTTMEADLLAVPARCSHSGHRLCIVLSVDRELMVPAN